MNTAFQIITGICAGFAGVLGIRLIMAHVHQRDWYDFSLGVFALLAFITFVILVLIKQD